MNESQTYLSISISILRNLVFTLILIFDRTFFSIPTNIIKRKALFVCNEKALNYFDETWNELH